MELEKKIRKERKLLRMAEIAIQMGNRDLAWAIIDDTFDDLNNICAWCLTESNCEYSMFSKELFREVEKYKYTMYNPFRNYEWANQ